MAPRLAFRRPLVLWTALVALGWRPLHLAQGLLLSLGLGPAPDLDAMEFREVEPPDMREVEVSSDVVDYVHDLIAALRSNPCLTCGPPARVAESFISAVRAFALEEKDRLYVTDNDVRALAVAAFAHTVSPVRMGRQAILEALATVPVKFPVL